MRAGVAAHQQGNYADAVNQFSVALQEAENFGPEHPDVAASLNNLAVLYRDQGKYTEAEPLYQRALAIWEKALGPEHPNVATSLNNLASLYTPRASTPRPSLSTGGRWRFGRKPWGRSTPT